MGISNTNLEDDLRTGGIREWGCNMHDDINA